MRDFIDALVAVSPILIALAVIALGAWIATSQPKEGDRK